MNVNVPTLFKYLLPIIGLHQAIMIRATYRSRQVPPGYDVEVPPRNCTHTKFEWKDIHPPDPEAVPLDKLLLENLYYLLPVIVVFVLIRLIISILPVIFNIFRTRHNNAQRDVSSNKFGQFALFRPFLVATAATLVLTGAIHAFGFDVSHLTGIPSPYLPVIITIFVGDVVALYAYISVSARRQGEVSIFTTEQFLESSTDTLLPEPESPVPENQRKSRKKKKRNTRKQVARRTEFIVARQTGEDQDESNYQADGESNAAPWRKPLREVRNASNIPRASNRSQPRSHAQHVPSGSTTRPRNANIPPRPKPTRTIDDLRRILGVSRPARPSASATVSSVPSQREPIGSARDNAVASNDVPKIFIEGEEVNGSLSVPKDGNDNQPKPSPVTPSTSSSVLMAESPFGPRAVDASAKSGCSLDLGSVPTPVKRTRRTLEVVSPAPKRGTLAEKLHMHSQPRRYRSFSPDRPVVDKLPELPLTPTSRDKSGFLPSLGSINELAEEEEPEVRAERDEEAGRKAQMSDAATAEEDKFTFRYSIPLRQEHRPLRALPARPPQAFITDPKRMDGRSDAWNAPKGLALGQNAVASVLGTTSGGTMVLWSTVPVTKPVLRHVRPRLG